MEFPTALGNTCMNLARLRHAQGVEIYVSINLATSFYSSTLTCMLQITRYDLRCDSLGVCTRKRTGGRTQRISSGVKTEFALNQVTALVSLCIGIALLLKSRVSPRVLICSL